MRSGCAGGATGRCCCICMATTSKRRSNLGRSPSSRSRLARREDFPSTCTPRSRVAVTPTRRLLCRSRSFRASAGFARADSPLVEGEVGSAAPLCTHISRLGTAAMWRPRVLRAVWALGLATAVACATAPPVIAHGFGQRYDLPIPLAFYLFGAAAAVLLSFAVFGLFVRGGDRAGAFRQRSLPVAAGRSTALAVVAVALKLAALAAFIVAVLAGFFGDQNPYRNIAPTLVWIIWWVGLVYVSAFAGDLWAIINPWRTVYDGADWLYRCATSRPALSWRLPYPRALGTWPACALLLAFAWIELVYPNPAVPSHIACLAVGYSLLTWGGMLLFGRDAWLRHGEVFTVFFGTIACFAPIGVMGGDDAAGRRLVLRPFGSGLLADAAVSTSLMAFVLLMLATVLYDGLLGTPEWSAFEGAVRASWAGPAE